MSRGACISSRGGGGGAGGGGAGGGGGTPGIVGRDARALFAGFGGGCFCFAAGLPGFFPLAALAFVATRAP